MNQDMLMILIFAVIIAAYGMIRRRRESMREEADARVIQCEVTYRDSVTTQAFLKSYFDSNLISVLNVNCYLENGEDEDLYTNVYKLFLPGTMTAAQLGGQLSACETVQRVHTKTE